MTNTENERRRFTRVAFDTAATLVQGDRVHHTNLVDISLNGLLVETPEAYEIRADQPCDVSIILGDSTEIQMKVKLVHSSSSVLGFKSDSIDMESIAHLRRLIELNLNDPTASDRVLSELLLPH